MLVFHQFHQFHLKLFRAVSGAVLSFEFSKLVNEDALMGIAFGSQKTRANFDRLPLCLALVVDSLPTMNLTPC